MKNIIVGIDFSTSSINAMRHAVALSIKTKATIHLIWVKSPGAANNAVGDDGQFMSHIQTKLQECAVMCRQESPESFINSIILEGKPHVEIIKYASNLPDSIIVMGTHGSSGFEEGYIGNNVYRLINNSEVPVLIMRENINIHRDLHKIFVPVDISFATLQKIKYAIELAKAFAAQIYLLGVVSPNDEDTRHIIEVQLHNAMDMCNEANVRCVAETLNVQGDVCNAILKSASDVDANIITIMREEAETDFTASRNMRQILSTSPMPLYIIPNVDAFNVGR